MSTSSLAHSARLRNRLKRTVIIGAGILSSATLMVLFQNFSPVPSTATSCQGPRAGENFNAIGKIYDLERIQSRLGGRQNLSGYTCPQIVSPPNRFDPPPFYLSDGVTKNPAFDAHMAPFRAYTAGLDRIGDDYLRSSSPEVAACLLSWLERWSRTTLLTEYNASEQGRINYTHTQGDYERKWLVGSVLFAVAKIKGAPGLNTTHLQKVRTWMSRTIQPMRLFYNNRIGLSNGQVTRSQNLNNHQYWAGVTFYLYGLVYDSPAERDWGTMQFRFGVQSIRPNGVLETEMARGGKAFIYHVFALQPLLTIAELAATRGENLYQSNGEALKRLIDLVSRSFDNFNNFTALTSVPQIDTAASIKRDLPYYLDWMEMLSSRFGTPGYAAHLREARANGQGLLKNHRLGGDMSLAFGLADCQLAADSRVGFRVADLDLRPSLVLGKITSAQAVNSSVVIEGWACQRRVHSSISVQLSKGTPTTSGGRVIKAQLANASVMASASCGTQGVAHKFRLIVSQNTIRPGERIFVTGMSNKGTGDKTLTGSGLTY